jgi:hypothetical protein
MPFSVLKSSGAPVVAPRNQPPKPGLPAPDDDPTSLTRTWKLPHCSRRVAAQAVPTGSCWFFSGCPSACMNRAMVWAAFVPNFNTPTPSPERMMASLVSGAVVVVGEVDSVVRGIDGGVLSVLPFSFLSSPPQAAPRSSRTDRRMSAARGGRISVMTAQSSQWGRRTGDQAR